MSTIPDRFARRRLRLAVATTLALAAPAQAQRLVPTTETGIGVWYMPGAPAVRDLWRPGDAGERLILSGRVRDTRGMPVANALVELWQADSDGVVHEGRYRTSLRTADDGGFRISTVLPGYIWGPRHVHVKITHPSFQTLITRVFFKQDPVVAESDHPELAIVLERGRVQDSPALFGGVELVLRGR